MSEAKIYIQERGHFSLPRSAAQDDRLSLETRGLLALMLSLPLDWDYTVTGPLPAATLTLANRLRGAADQLTELMIIAEDGRIDEDERPAFDLIVEDLREIIAAMYQVIYAPGTKKDRPEADTSGRSCSGNKARNDCNYSVTQPGGNVKPLSREVRT